MKPTSANASGMILGLTSKDVAAILSRGKWRLLGVFLVVSGSVTVLTMLIKPTYESTASLLVDTRQSSSALFEDVRTLGMSVDVIQNEMAKLNSRSLSENVAQRLIALRYMDSAQQVLLPILSPIEGDTLNPVIASEATVTFRVEKMMTFGSERESYVITITATSTHPKESALLANIYAKSYSDRNVFDSRTKSRSFREFLGGQLNEKRAALRKIEDTLRVYMQQSGVVSLDQETRTLMEQVSTLEAQRDANEIEIRSLLTTLASYQNQIRQQEKSIAKAISQASDPYIRKLQEELAQLEVQRDITVAKIPRSSAQGLNNAQLREIDAQIADLRQKLRSRTQEYVENILPAGEQPDREPDPTGYLKEIKQKFLETQIMIQTLQAKRDAMNEAIRPYERKFASVPAKTVEFARLSREKSSLEQLYGLLETKYNEANVTEQAEIGYVQIIDPAVVPQEPSSPSLPMNIALGIILGLGMGVALVFVKESLQQRLYSPEDLVKKGFVPLSTIGRFDAKGKETSARGLGKSGRGEFAYRIAITSPFSPVTESFRHLRTNLHAAQNGIPPKTLMVTSSNPGEGKTTVACNLAVVLAQSGRKVLLVDADMREPAIHTAFGLDSKTGLAQILSGKSDHSRLIYETRVPNLRVLCCGQSSTNAAELLESADMRFLVSQLAEAYDVVIFDSPPVLAVTDALILSKLVHGVILVVSAGGTTLSTVQRAADMLTKVGAKMFGVVLNNFDLRRAYGFLSSGSGYGYYGYADRYGGGEKGNQREATKPRVA